MRGLTCNAPCSASDERGLTCNVPCSASDERGLTCNAPCSASDEEVEGPPPHPSGASWRIPPEASTSDVMRDLTRECGGGEESMSSTYCRLLIVMHFQCRLDNMVDVHTSQCGTVSSQV